MKKIISALLAVVIMFTVIMNCSNVEAFGAGVAVPKVTNFKSTASSSIAIKLTWSKVKCTKYFLYRYDTKTKKYELIKKLTGTTYTDTGLTQFTKYNYRVKAVTVKGKNIYYGVSVPTTCYTKPTAPSLKLTYENKTPQLSWGANSKASGYQIYRSENMGALKLVHTIRDNKVTTFTDTNTVKGRVYTYRIRSFRKLNGKTYFSNWSSLKCTHDSLGQLSRATLTPHRTMKVYNKQGASTTSYNITLTSKDISILKAFAAENFEKGMTREQKLRTTLEWINKNVKYAYGTDWNKIADKSWVEAIFTHKLGQCAQYNGAMAAMMIYMGFDAYMIQGYRGSWEDENYWQHFWCEVNLGGFKYIMETGNYGKNGEWMYFLAPYAETSGYITNCKNVGRTY